MRRRPVAVLVCVAIALAGCGTSTSNEVTCEAGDTLVLSAQAVPSATMLPCVTAFPTGWVFGGFVAESGRVRYWMDSDRAGTHAVEVELTEVCDTSGAVATGPHPGFEGVEGFEGPATVDPPSGVRFFTFTGGCIALRYDFAEGSAPELVSEVVENTAFVPRTVLVTKMGEDRGLVLCGAGVPECP